MLQITAGRTDSQIASRTPLVFGGDWKIRNFLHYSTSMASSAHSAFPPRAYGTNQLGKLPDRSLAGAFGASTTQQAREAQRKESERERAEKERAEREKLNGLTEEQREEIKEAVRYPPRSRLNSNYANYVPSLRFSTWIKTKRSTIMSSKLQ